MKKFILTLLAVLLSISLFAQGRIAGVCNMYENPVEENLSTSEGYEPWVISHYGRHGARFLTSSNLYDSVYDVFAEQEVAGNLTEYGKEVYDKLLSIKSYFDGNAGKLTRKGEQQHRDIAKRMKKRFPSIFESKPEISAISSTSPRAIKSMEAFCKALKCRKIEMRADSADLNITNPFANLEPCDAVNYSSKASWKPYFRAYTDDLIDTSPFEAKMFKNGYSSKRMSLITFEARLFNIIQNLPCLDFKAPSFNGLFSEEEKELLWERDNINSFQQASAGFYGTERRYSLCWPLLEDMILTAEKDLKSSKPSVRLRFGHDIVINGLLTLLGIEGRNQKAGSYAEIKDVFQNWKVPMAQNVQMVLYKNKSNDAQSLVRLYVHEKAVTLPLNPVGDRLYNWNDFKDYYLGVVAEAFRIMKKPACNYLFSIKPEYHGHAMQAFSIYDDIVYVGYDSGLCRTYDYNTGKQISEFPLGCNIKSNHCGNLNFSDSLLYISGDLQNKSCYVEKISPYDSELVQTIKFELTGDYGGSQAIIDTDRGRIVYMRRLYSKINRKDNEFLISEFPLPSVLEGDITYYDKDIIRTYKLQKYFPIYQGASISDGKLYQSFGGPSDWPSSEGTGFAVFDLSDGRLLKVVRLPFGEEPQSVLKYKGRILMNFNGHGLFEVINHSSQENIVAAYIWPSCHDDSLAREHLWGEGIGEWEVIKKGNPRFEGHYQPKEPLWGYELDDDPEVVEKWINTALEYGVNTFIYDWYWYKGHPFLESALNNGFLKAPSNRKMNFYIMWANHDVKFNYWNVHRYPGNEDILFSADVTEEEYKSNVKRIITQYFSKSNYLKINGRPVMAIYSYNNLVRSFGSVEKTAKALDYFREQAKKAGYKGIYLMDVRGEGGRLTESRLSNTKMRIDSLGVDGISFYNMGGFNVDYIKHGKRSLELRKAWDLAFDVDLFPCVSVAWDDTPRFPHKGEKDVSRINVSPEYFKIFLAEAKDFVLKNPCQPPIITINAWNEWVEGSYLLPDKHYGFGYLEAVKDVITDKRNIVDIMSFNIRNGNAKDGENSWEYRKKDLCDLLNYENPDIIGMQEVHDFQLNDILQLCHSYASVGAGRDDGKKGEQTPILWKKSRFNLQDWGYFWLSETPEIPSIGWDAKYLRTATWTLLKDKTSGQSFYVINTHLDNKGIEAKKKGLELIEQRMSLINSTNLPVVLTGDFNVENDNQIILNLNARMHNCRELASVSDYTKSFNAWGDKSKASLIDYIYYKGFEGCYFFQTIKDGINGKTYISDHYPIRTKLIIK